MQKLFYFLINNWEQGLGLAVILYELIMRLKPTEKNRSLIDLVFKIISAILPNLRKKTGTENIVDVTNNGTPLNNIKVPVNKHIVKTIFLLFMFGLSFAACAQTNQLGKLISSANADSVTAKTVAQNLYNTYGGQSGSLYYNWEHTPPKWRIFSNGVWSDLAGSSGGGSGTITGGDEGLHRNGTNIRLGGTLNIDTVITGNGNLLFNNTAVEFSSGTLNISNPLNTFEYNIAGSAIAADRTVTLPLLTGNDDFVTAAATQTVTNKTFGATGYRLFNPAQTFRYTMVGDAITADRTITYPIINNNAIMVTANATTGTISGRVPFWGSGGAANSLTNDSGFTFTSTGDVLTTGSLTASASGTANVTVSPGTNGSSTLLYNSLSFTKTGAVSVNEVGASSGISGQVGGAALRLSGGDAFTTGNNLGGDIELNTGDGNGTGRNGRIKVLTGSNRNCGTAVLVAGTVTVNNTMISASTIIILTTQISGGTPGAVYISARVAGTSFTITSTSGTDTSTVGWLLIEPF